MPLSPCRQGAGHDLLEQRTLAIVPAAQMIPQIVQERGGKEMKKQDGKEPKNLFSLGDIDYDATPHPAAPPPARVKKEFPHRRGGSSHFEKLSATQFEVASIQKLYHDNFSDEKGILTLEKDKATKTAFLTEAGQCRNIHLATHGFFVEEKLPSPFQRGSEGFGEMLRGPEATAGHVALLSGLALAAPIAPARPPATWMTAS